VIMAIILSLSVSGDLAIPRAEHPRPDFGRTQWQTLNGTWQFCFDPKDEGLSERWYEPNGGPYDRTILVPFPWESKLSGIERPDYDGVAWYRREFTLPKSWEGRRAHLCFGAVDWHATVWVNGKLVGTHEGGYSEFRFDVTDYLRSGHLNRLVVRVYDVTDTSTPIGKQIPSWYTSTSGIWQPVWLETTGPAWLSTLRMTPLADDKHAPTGVMQLDMRFGGDASRVTSVVVESKDKAFAPVTMPAKDGSATGELRVPSPRLWTPEQPNLYAVRIRLRDADGKDLDVVHTYFGVRTIAWERAPGKDYSQILLNGKPVFTNGALDQSFNPEGIYTAPSDTFMRRDIELAKAAGFNMLRIHIKAEEPRRLYWADKLGILIQADIPCFYEVTEAARRRFEQGMREQIERDYNHPSIYGWTVFNEEWGIWNLTRQTREHRVDWVERMFHLAKELDPTRLIQDNTGWSHLVTDLNSYHWYGRDVDGFRRHYQNVNDREIRAGSGWNYIADRKQRGEPFINNEYGYVSAGDGDGDWTWGTLAVTNAMRGHDRMCGLTYTELTDIEWEHNGVYNYDRSPKETGFEAWCPGMRVRDLFANDFVVLDVPAIKDVAPGENVSVPVALSHFSHRSLVGATIEWEATVLDSEGASSSVAKGVQAVTGGVQGSLTPQDDIRFGAPYRSGILTLATKLVTSDGVSLHRNYTQWLVGDPASLPRIQSEGGHSVTLRFRPEDWAQSEFSRSDSPDPPIADKHYGLGAGTLRYEIAVPKGLPIEKLESLRFVCEVASKAGREKVDWPERVNPQDYPQTDGTKYPSKVEVRINGVHLTTWQLPDDPADARGVLSHRAGVERGSYGYLMAARADARKLTEIRRLARESGKIEIELHVPEAVAGGVAVYGAKMGRYPMDPSLHLVFRDPIAPAVSDQSVATNRYVDRFRILSPSAPEGGAVWRYTTAKPADGWSEVRFDDAEWSEGRSGFGTRGTPGAVIGTVWDGAGIWLRRTFEHSGPMPEAVYLHVHHDEDCIVFLNGVKVFEGAGFLTAYRRVKLAPEAAAALREGRNLLAVTCRQTGGGQFIDVGLSAVVGR